MLSKDFWKSLSHDAQNAPVPAAPKTAALTNSHAVDDLASLLAGLESSAPAVSELAPPDNALVRARLGVASGLFISLESKHKATAHHAARVAVLCSHWATVMRLPDEQRDALEIAALLHDVGKIGVPDAILLKPTLLTPEEASLMSQHWEIGQRIVQSCCGQDEVLEIFCHARSWFDGTTPGSSFCGRELPLGSRMLAVADAFDAMTSPQLYRLALPRERALGELLQYAGTQFDPELVQGFCQHQSWDIADLTRRLQERWLGRLQTNAQHGWALQNASQDHAPTRGLFERKLLEHMHDGVVFVDVGGRITHWSRGAHRLLGVDPETVLQRPWSVDLIGLASDKGEPVTPDRCPVALALQNGTQSIRRMTARGRSGRRLAVNLHIVPVHSADAICQGAILLFHDCSPEASLEERCENLYELATKDPLTQVANRAEFDRVHEQVVQLHRERNHPCSLIVTDVDRFKSVNDTYGHQAGDEVLKSVAKVLRAHAHSGDLVARFGGEEFVALLADCDSAAAMQRAEEMRKALAAVVHPTLNGRNVTASFGVTEVQPGDSPQTMLKRADRALYQAKETGRNKVVQLGAGPETGVTQAANPIEDVDGGVLRQVLISSNPIPMCVEKLRGFIADQDARVLATERNRVELEVGHDGLFFRRSADRGGSVRIELKFEERTAIVPARHMSPARQVIQTVIHVCVSPNRRRDRRRAEASQRSRTLLASLRSYLMAAEFDPPSGD